MKQFFLAFMISSLVGLNIWALIQTSSASAHSALTKQIKKKEKKTPHYKEKFTIVELDSPDSPIFLKLYSDGRIEKVQRKHVSNRVVFVSPEEETEEEEGMYF